MKEPLAYRLRPQSLDEVLGQTHILQDKGLLKRCINEKRLFSMIFFGPPGSGKTTVASILAKGVDLPLKEFNAVTGNKKDLDEIFSEAKIAGQLVLVVDEVHRLNKDKQDLLLPYVEDGKVIMIGLTTTNPYFSINPAIRSRCLLVEFKALSDEEMRLAITQALNHPKADLKEIILEDGVKDALVKMSNGDVRIALNTLEVLSIVYPSQTITTDELSTLHLSANQNFDSSDDGYYDALSAFQKSIRGSDVDGALYYLARLIIAEDLDSIERRLLVTAYEDIGLANPALVGRTIAAIDTARRVGFPEAIIPLGDIVIDLTLSPKSKSGVNAIAKAIQEVKNHPLPVPPYLRLTPVNMKDDDKYDYGRPDIWAKIQYLPDGVKDLPFYVPNESSPYENTLKHNLDELNKIKRTKDIKSLK
ncbi:MAG: replication-associated recombination protein A [Erysipelotrichaceae bacterium]|nr:replication-associated recombination protein A [Erysipelotrichaceae bacterium]